MGAEDGYLVVPCRYRNHRFCRASGVEAGSVEVHHFEVADVFTRTSSISKP